VQVRDLLEDAQHLQLLPFAIVIRLAVEQGPVHGLPVGDVLHGAIDQSFN